MKRFFKAIPLLVFIYCTHLSQGQIMDTTIRKMLDVEIVTLPQAQKIDQMIREMGDSQPPSFYLYLLYQFQYFPDGKIVNSPLPLSDQLRRIEKSAAAILVTNDLQDSLLHYLEKLRSCNLISYRQFAKQAQKIRQKDCRITVQLLGQLYMQCTYDEAIGSSRLQQCSSRLLDNEIMSPASYKMLQEDINAEKIDAPAQLIRYCQHARVFNLMDYTDNPLAAIEGVFRDISTIFPELAFSDYQQSEVVDPYKNPMFKKMQVTLQANGKKYKAEVHLLALEMKPDTTFTYTLGQQGFCQVFNEMLTDIRSTWRLHEISTPYLNKSSSLYHFLGVIALKKPQTDMFGALNDILKISGANYKNSLTAAQIDAAISAYCKTDLLKHVGAGEIDAVRRTAVFSGIQHFSELLALFPHVVFLYEPYVGDREEKPYTRLLRGYADITRGEFAPTDIVEIASTEKDGPITLRFRWNDKTWEQVLQREHSHVSPDFYTLMERLGGDLPGKFHLLYDAQWRSAIIYLHPEEYAQIAAGGFVVSQLDGIMEED